MAPEHGGRGGQDVIIFLVAAQHHDDEDGQMMDDQSVTAAEHSCPCGETIQKVTYFELDRQPWVEFDHGLVIHRFETDADGRIMIAPAAPRVDGA